MATIEVTGSGTFDGTENDDLFVVDGDAFVWPGLPEFSINGGGGYDVIQLDVTLAYFIEFTSSEMTGIEELRLNVDSLIDFYPSISLPVDILDNYSISNPLLISGYSGETMFGFTDQVDFEIHIYDTSKTVIDIGASIQFEDIPGNAGYSPLTITVNDREIQRSIFGTENNDRILISRHDRGNTDLSTFFGLGGNDSFRIWNAAIIDGGDGFDSLRFAGSQEAVTANFRTAIFSGSFEGTQISSIEGALGSSNDDLIIADNLGMWIDGGSGDDALYGGDGVDTLRGSSGNDRLFGRSGNDDLHGGNGNDLLRGENGRDILDGDQGNDRLYGGAGNDVLQGGYGDDRLYGGAGADSFDGGEGQDFVRYDDANYGSFVVSLADSTQNTGVAAGDTFVDIEGIFASRGNDTIIGNDDANRLFGLAGDDDISGDAGNDRLMGGEGNDVLYGGLGADFHDGGNGTDFARYDERNWGDLIVSLVDPTTNTGAAAGDTYANVEGLVGGAGNDRLTGDFGKNSIYGGEGQDTIIGLADSDILNGGDGDDLIFGGGGSDHIHGGLGADRIHGGDGIDFARYDEANYGNLKISLQNTSQNTGVAAGDEYFDVEGLVGGAGDDIIFGNAANNSLWGSSGNDRIFDGAGNDTVFLGFGDDMVVVGGGVDHLSGDIGTDCISYIHSPGGVTLNLTTNVTSGSWADDDTILGFESATGSLVGNDHITGTNGVNIIRTLGGDDVIRGVGGDDILHGGGGNDFVLGGGGSDRLTGGDGIDRLIGGTGNDILIGGAGADIFRFRSGDGSDVVRDFEYDMDTLQFGNFGFLTNATDALSYAGQVGADVVFDFGAAGSLRVKNVTLVDLSDDIAILL